MSRQQVNTTDNNRRRAYVEGNTVRKFEAMPQRDPREIREREARTREEEARRRNAKRAARANREKAMQMSPGYILFLTAAVFVTVCVCVAYIQLQSDVSSRMRNVASLENQVLDLKTDNDAALKRIEISVNLDEIKNIAINQLGMVYPSQEQIHYFTVENKDYMNQYQEIPEK